MKPLYETINALTKHGRALTKYLSASGINDWNDLTRARLYDFRDTLRDKVSPGSAKTYAATLSAILKRYSEEGVIPCAEFASILRMKGEGCTKTYLTPEEIGRLERTEPTSPAETYVLNEFLVGCKMGARISDIRELTPENVQDGVLTYTSIKTGITASVPCSKTTAERIEWLRTNGTDMPLMTYNRIIRRLCKRAGITTPVKVHRGGRDEVGPKWMFVSSHTARISLATNMSAAGTPTNDIKSALGHTNELMTSHYIVAHEIKFNDRTAELFK